MFDLTHNCPQHVWGLKKEHQQERKTRQPAPGLSKCISKKLRLSNSANWTVASAGTTINASARVDYVAAVALGDSANWALASARTTADASITDLISHCVAPPIMISPILYHKAEKKQLHFWNLQKKEIRKHTSKKGKSG